MLLLGRDLGLSLMLFMACSWNLPPTLLPGLMLGPPSAAAPSSEA